MGSRCHSAAIVLDAGADFISPPSTALESILECESFFRDVHVLSSCYTTDVRSREPSEQWTPYVERFAEKKIGLHFHTGKTQVDPDLLETYSCVYVPPDLDFKPAAMHALEASMRHKPYGTRFAVSSMHYVPDDVSVWLLPFYGLALVVAVVEAVCGYTFPLRRHRPDYLRSHLLVSNYFSRRQPTRPGCFFTTFGLGWLLRNKTINPVSPLDRGACVSVRESTTPLRFSWTLDMIVFFFGQWLFFLLCAYWAATGIPRMLSFGALSFYGLAGLTCLYTAVVLGVALKRFLVTRMIFLAAMVGLYPVWAILAPLLLVLS